MNNAYDEKYEIRLAKYDEIPEIMNFIENYWKKGHIIAKNRKFFEYEYTNNGRVNFIIAKNKKTQEIEALQGFIQASDEIKNRDIWGSILKVRNDHPNIPFLGIEIGQRLREITQPKNILGLGVNPNTALLIHRDILKFHCDKMNHYYRLNDCKEYKIALIKEKIILKRDTNIKQLNPKEVFSIDELEEIFDFSLIKNQIPYKDKWYFNRRFFNHPIYKYRVFALKNAFFVIREQIYNSSKILRIVDFAGEQETFSYLYDFFENLIKDYEYIDFYNLGFNETYLTQAGFVKREKDCINIIPNYFQPFVQENIEIYIVGNKDAVYYRADADQDRPN